MKIVLTGGTGFIGGAFKSFLLRGSHEVVCLSRNTRDGFLSWDPDRGLLPDNIFDGTDAVVHLAGEPLASGLWTKEKKARIFKSRIASTSFLATRLAALPKPPAVFVSASAIGFYGNRGDAPLSEESPRGSGFLADVCAAWEEAAQPARDAGIRVVHPRFGLVLSTEGGIFSKMELAFRCGLGGAFGSGRQIMSWVSLEDALGALAAALADKNMAGPVNVVSPTPVSNNEFVKSLGAALKRPVFFRTPAWALRLLLRDMAEEMLLSSARVVPDRLQKAGFQFQLPTLASLWPRLLKA